MGTPVEIEFAVNLACRRGERCEFGFLQMRPLALTREIEALELGEVDDAKLVCRSDRVLGNGRIEGIRDLVVVDFKRFERAQSPETAAEVARFNGRLLGEERPYVLIGVGRWGSRGPVARDPGDLGPDRRGPGHRRGRPPGPQGERPRRAPTSSRT